MKKASSGFQEEYSYLRIYRNHIEDIVSLLKEVTTDISIKVDDFILDDINEIDKLKKEFASSIIIETTNPRVYIHILNWEVSIITYSDDSIVNAVLIRVDYLFRKLKDKIWEFFRERSFYIFLFTSLPLFVASYVLDNPNLSKILLISGLIFILIALSNFFFVGRPRNLISLKYKHETSSFFKRNKDEILIAVFFYILGIISNYFWNFLF